MNPIPTDLISAIPDSIKAEKEECQDAADAALMVLFTMANELEAVPVLPPIISNGVEVYPLPAPWLYEPPLRLGGLKIDTKEVLGTVNEWLPHVKKNAHAYNEALAVNDVPTAVRVAEQGCKDSATVWNTCNAVAESVEEDSVYRPILLSPETKKIYYTAQLEHD